MHGGGARADLRLSAHGHVIANLLPSPETCSRLSRSTKIPSRDALLFCAIACALPFYHNKSGCCSNPRDTALVLTVWNGKPPAGSCGRPSWWTTLCTVMPIYIGFGPLDRRRAARASKQQLTDIPIAETDMRRG